MGEMGSTAPPPPAPELNRDQLRSRRKRAVRATTLREPRIGRARVLDALNEVNKRLTVVRDFPATRASCEGGHRPCPYVSCRYNLYADVNPSTGSMKLNFPDLEPDQMGESCVLDVADRGGSTLEDVGAIMNVTRERVRQLEVMALQKLETSAALASIAEDIASPDDTGSGLELVAVLRRGPA